MKVHRHCDCSCHGLGMPAGAAMRGGMSGAPPSTGFFVLALSLSLLICGLISTGVISIRFW